MPTKREVATVLYVVGVGTLLVDIVFLAPAASWAAVVLNLVSMLVSMVSLTALYVGFVWENQLREAPQGGEGA